MSTDAEVAQLQARLQRLQQSQQQAAAQLSAAAAAPRCAPPAGPSLTFGALFARALPAPHVTEFSLPGEFSLMRNIPYQHVDVNKYPPEHRPKKLRAGLIQVRSAPLSFDLRRRMRLIAGARFLFRKRMQGHEGSVLCGGRS